MQMLGVDELVLSERALRRLIVDWMLRQGFWKIDSATRAASGNAP